MSLEYYGLADIGYLYAALVIVFATCLTAAISITRSERRGRP